METGLRGKKVLVTGGASGIGLGISRVLAGEGMHIAIASRNPDEGVKREIERMNVPCELLKADVSDLGNVQHMVHGAIQALGGLDCFVNCAAWTWHEPITKLSQEAWSNTIDTNLRAAVFGCKHVAKYMIECGSGGSMVIIGSTSRFFPAFGETSYRISKMGLKMLMEDLVIELAPHRIRVNMVTPGHFVTRMTAGIDSQTVDKIASVTPAQRTGRPEEVGNAVAFLLSDQLSGFTYGADLVVDGGLTMNPLLPPEAEQIRRMNR